MKQSSEKRSPQLKLHWFICTNQRADGASCAQSGSVQLRDGLKKLCKEKFANHKGEFRINSAGCLGRCEEGIAAVCYPQAEWKTNLQLTDAEKLFEITKMLLEKP